MQLNHGWRMLEDFRIPSELLCSDTTEESQHHAVRRAGTFCDALYEDRLFQPNLSRSVAIPQPDNVHLYEMVLFAAGNWAACLTTPGQGVQSIYLKNITGLITTGLQLPFVTASVGGDPGRRHLSLNASRVAGHENSGGAHRYALYCDFKDGIMGYVGHLTRENRLNLVYRPQQIKRITVIADRTSASFERQVPGDEGSDIAIQVIAIPQAFIQGRYTIQYFGKYIVVTVTAPQEAIDDADSHGIALVCDTEDPTPLSWRRLSLRNIRDPSVSLQLVLYGFGTDEALGSKRTCWSQRP